MRFGIRRQSPTSTAAGAAGAPDGRSRRQAHRFRPHPGAGPVLRAHVDVVEGGRWRGQIAPVVRAPALRALERAPRDEPGRGRLVPEVQPVLPRQVVLPSAGHRRLLRAPADLLDLAERDLEPLAAPDQADAVPHHAAEPRLQIVDLLASRPLERGEDAPRGGVHRRARHPQAGPSRHPVGHHVAGDAAENGGLGDAIAAESIGSVHAARVLARGEQPFQIGVAGAVDRDAAHHEVRGGSDLHGRARQVIAEVAAALDHAAEAPLHDLGPEMRDVDPHAAMGCPPALDHLGEAGARDEVARRALHARWGHSAP